MAIVTGVLADFLRSALSNSEYNLQPVVVVVPSGPATLSPSALYVPRKLSFIPTVSTGVLTMDLEPTDAISPATWYTIEIHWLDPVGLAAYVDYVPWPLFVPSAGGNLADLLATPWNPILAWWGLTPPTGTPVPNTLWLETDTGTLSIWSN